MAATGGTQRFSVAIQPAGLKVRCIARMLDCLFAAVAGAVTYLVLTVIGIPDAIAAAPAAVFGFLYFVIFEVTTGSTPAKRLFELVIEGTGPDFHPTLLEAAIRNSFILLGLVPIIGLPLLLVAAASIAVTIALDDAHLGIHDRLANGTQVVRV